MVQISDAEILMAINLHNPWIHGSPYRNTIISLRIIGNFLQKLSLDGMCKMHHERSQRSVLVNPRMVKE